nr:MAG TPA: hypothetical protein [Bacteriophage sp.]
MDFSNFFPNIFRLRIFIYTNIFDKNISCSTGWCRN